MGDLTGPNPVDRGTYGSKIHLITERTGLPLSVGISGANLHDGQALEPLVRGIPPIRSRRGRRRRKPARLHADKGYDYAHLRRWLRGRGIKHRIAHRGIESSQRTEGTDYASEASRKVTPLSCSAAQPAEEATRTRTEAAAVRTWRRLGMRIPLLALQGG